MSNIYQCHHVSSIGIVHKVGAQFTDDSRMATHYCCYKTEVSMFVLLNAFMIMPVSILSSLLYVYMYIYLPKCMSICIFFFLFICIFMFFLYVYFSSSMYVYMYIFLP